MATIFGGWNVHEIHKKGGKHLETTSILSGLLSEISSSLTQAIAEAAPAAGLVMATIAGIYLGVKIFKRVTGART